SQDHGPRRIGRIIPVRKCSAQLRARAQSFKEPAGGADRHHIHRQIPAIEDGRVGAISGHLLEASAPLAPVVKRAGADTPEIRMIAHLITHAALLALPCVYQTVRIFVAQRFENDAVEDAEDRGVGPDAERERENDDECEDRFLQQCARAVAQVLPECLHNSLLVFKAVGFLSRTLHAGWTSLPATHSLSPFLSAVAILLRPRSLEMYITIALADCALSRLAIACWLGSARTPVL